MTRLTTEAPETSDQLFNIAAQLKITSMESLAISEHIGTQINSRYTEIEIIHNDIDGLRDRQMNHLANANRQIKQATKLLKRAIRLNKKEERIAKKNKG